MKKKRVLLLIVSLIFFAVYLNINVNAQCDGCTPGTSESGGICGGCGFTMKRDCDANTNWGGWYCSGDCSCVGSNPSVTISWLVPTGTPAAVGIGICNWPYALQRLIVSGPGGFTEDLCYDPSNPSSSKTWNGAQSSTTYTYEVILPESQANWALINTMTSGSFTTLYCCASNQGQSCGNCGTIDCSGNCINQGPCSSGQTSCSGDTTLTCGSNCQWQSGQNCNTQDGWYGGGNTQTATCGSVDNDASSEYRDYGCSGGSCTYSVTQTQNCNNQDGWYGGGNNAGCGTDPNSVWNDYYVIPNTGSCTSTTTCSGTANCDSNDICNNKCEGNVFISVPPMKDYYVVPNSNSCTSTTDTPVTEDCATKTSTDTDGSPTAYTIPGTVTDYTSCTLSGCGSNSYSDSCSGTILTEYGASGSSFTQSNYDCQNLESNYCSGDRYYRNKWTCSGSPGSCTDAPDTPIGTNADNDAKDKECGDSLCDNAAGVYDSTKTASESGFCSDGLDNDCDGLTDCQDPDCAGSITGNVKNTDSQPISSADMNLKKDLITVKTATTNQQGSYSLTSVNCGSYNLIASHPDYAPKTQTFSLAPNQQLTINFDGSNSLALGTSCESDCTFAADNIIHASCDGKSGCTFYDSTAKTACDNAQPGWVRDYNLTHYVTCASGTPQPKVEIQASVSCASGTLVKVTRIVVYNGKPVKLVVATCG